MTAQSELGPELPGLTCLAKLGSGGYSDVYLYEREPPLRLKVAVKLLRGDLFDETQLQQFTDEANTMATLAQHPYIVEVLGADLAPDGRPYLVMRYYPPPDLGARVAAEPLGVANALKIGIQLASAVETAHRAGIVHRDIKPSNVLMSTYDEPGLTDFGIAGKTGESDEEDDPGVSIPWSPPEVLTSASNGSVASDVYSLAATIWNLLVGRSPFAVRGGDNSDRALFARIVHTTPPVTGRADVPGGLDRLLQQAMAKKPAHRPKSAIDFARGLQRVEQQLRLARTEIVVLDATTTAAEDDAPAMAEPVRQEAGDVTQMKAPTRVSIDSGPRRAVAPSESGVTMMRPARPHDDLPTQARPTRGKRVRATPPKAPDAPPTSQRPAAVSQVTGVADPEAVEGASLKKPLVIGAAALALVVAVTIGTALSRGGNQRDKGALPTAPGPTQPCDVGACDSLVPPVLSSPAFRQGKLVFTWEPAASPKKSDQFVWRQAQPSGGAADEQQHTTAKTSVTLATENPESTCIQVLVRRGSAASIWSAAMCGN